MDAVKSFDERIIRYRAKYGGSYRNAIQFCKDGSVSFLCTTCRAGEALFTVRRDCRGKLEIKGGLSTDGLAYSRCIECCEIALKELQEKDKVENEKWLAMERS